MKEVTLFVTSCGRPDLLKITLESFVKYNTYPIKEAIICEDSGIIGLIDFAKLILPYKTEIYYNKKRIGQMKTIEKYTALIKTDWVFHLEDDWEFYDYGFIELSFKIFESDKNISQVLLEDEQHEDYFFYKVDINNVLCYKVLTNNPNDKTTNNGDGALTPFSWRPSLKPIEIQKLRMPYQDWDDEYTIQLAVNKIGYYSVITKHENNGKKGFCHHTGKNRHVENNTKNIKIIGREDFTCKKEIKLKDMKPNSIYEEFLYNNNKYIDSK